MINPKSYVQINHLQRSGAQKALQEIGNTINWRCDGRDSILDVGCGPGDVTFDILMPILPANFQRLVGVDMSNEMIDYARKTYVYPKLSFELFDLSKDLEEQPFRNAKPFDHIFSSYVLMWTSNLETCIRNFCKLLVPTGDMVLLYDNYPVFDVYKEQSRDKRWAKYMWNVDDKRPPFQGSKNLKKDFCDLLSSHGFTDCDLRIRERNIIHKDVDSLREFLQVTNAFLDRMPANDREPYMDDLMQKMIKRCIRPNGDEDNNEIIVPYSDVLIYAKKTVV